MRKNYNCGRKKLQLPEYGRHIHEMVDYLSTIENRDERNRQARSVIAVMGNLNPFLRDTADYNHKLWDHLFIMAGFNLDVDSPYPIPSSATLAPRPAKMRYPTRRIAIKHYGKNIENIIRSLVNIKDKQVVDEIIGNIAKLMRVKSFEYNQEHPNNESIIKDIGRMSDNMIIVDENAINNLKTEYKQRYTTHSRKSGYTTGKQNKITKNGKNQPSKGMKQNRGWQK